MLFASETLTVEFKSNRKRLPDDDLIEAVVCLANAVGGELWLGVEDDGIPTGLHAEHRSLAFWLRVERAMPDYAQRKAWLAEHGMDVEAI
jgi:predicted HTH transcriptional regulator